MSIDRNGDILKFLEIVGRLKHTKRTGWMLRDVNDPECVAGHMYRMGIMTFLLEEKSDLDRLRCLQIALVHDLAEAIVGDLTPYCGISPEEKHKKEDVAMKSMISLIGVEQGDSIYKLYKEYETQSSNEAKFVKDLDRFDMVLQAFEYEKKENKPNRLQEFFDSTSGKLSHPFIIELMEELNRQRDSYQRSRCDQI